MIRYFIVMALFLVISAPVDAWQFETLETKGSAYERGVQHGKAFRGQIEKDFTQKGGWAVSTNPIHLRPRVLHYLLRPLLAWPEGRELIEEMQGIADGSGRTFEEIAAFNLTWDHNEKAACSMALMPGGSEGPVLINTLDDFTSGKFQQNYPLFVQIIRPTKGHAMVALCNYGAVWAHQGLNSAGVAISSTSGGLGAPRGGSNYDGVYYGLLSRYALQFHDSAQQTIDLYAANLHTSKGINIGVLDRQGVGAVFEFSSFAIGIRRIEGSKPMAATNFFQTDKYPPYTPDIEKYPYQINARARYARLEGLFATQPSPSIEDARAMLLDTNGGVEGQVCQDNKVMYTVMGSVFDCQNARASVYITHPTDGKPVDVKLVDKDNPKEGPAAPASAALAAVLAAEAEKPVLKHLRYQNAKVVAVDGTMVTCEADGKTFQADMQGGNLVPHVLIPAERVPEGQRVDFNGKLAADGKHFVAERIEAYTPPLPWEGSGRTSSLRREADKSWTIVYGDGKTVPVTLAEGCKIYMRHKGKPADLKAGMAVEVYGNTVVSDQPVRVTWLLYYP